MLRYPSVVNYVANNTKQHKILFQLYLYSNVFLLKNRLKNFKKSKNVKKRDENIKNDKRTFLHLCT